jgi:CheY-specific phosphatase CheX
MSQNASMPVMVRSLDMAVAETLETMFFSDAQNPADGEVTWHNSICSEVRFTGDAEGWLQLRMSKEGASRLAANFLGLDPPEVSRFQLESVCGEMANMICGAMVSTASPEGTFFLTPPEIIDSGLVSPASAVIRTYQTEADLMEVRLSCSAITGCVE